ncbi:MULTISPECIES: MBL fold metallo-hydrolase RNA specificity domain-containing protein [Aminobacterium]|jgi:metallo-beta-lactamase family protein|uniref:MBL fold metallo-hydrolase RNA specificity domain-containing protein n=1 Tax=Aminobacterium TaxID=81466 RepID=UPI0004657D8A|nr:MULTISPECIES: MBL fold metallo-hydrolase [Aminobacterium]
MRLKVLGAAGEVTGSNYLIECGKSRILVDCGMYQGRGEDTKNRSEFDFVPSSIDAVLLTHAHIDHSGRVPLLVQRGFKGKIWATLPTVELVNVLWQDSVRLMKEEAEWKTRKNARKGLPPVEPLYTQEYAERASQLLSPATYDDKIEVAPHISVRFRDAGHILGSAILEIWLQEDGDEVKIVFSGDLGPQETVMERNPAIISRADYVVIESTYGDRLHRSNDETRAEFRSVIKEALRSRAKVMIPTFVVDRAQRILFELMLLQKEGILRDGVPIFFDSPMGVKATEIYNHHLSLLSREIQGHVKEGDDPFSPKHLQYVESVEDSRQINDIKHAIVMAGSGMCNGGRIVHHLKHGIWDPHNQVVFVGYQARGTIGRRLVDGEKTLRIAGEELNVKAKLHTINGFSAHGDKNDLLAWAGNFENRPVFFITHGEPKSSMALVGALKERGLQAMAPVVGEEFELTPLKGIETSISIPAAVPRIKSLDQMNDLLTDIVELAASIRAKSEEVKEPEPLLPLLQSTIVLLETAEQKTGIFEEKEV